MRTEVQELLQVLVTANVLTMDQGSTIFMRGWEAVWDSEQVRRLAREKPTTVEQQNNWNEWDKLN